MDYKTNVKAAVALLLICRLFHVHGNNNGIRHLLGDEHDQPQQQQQLTTTIIDAPPSPIIQAAKTFLSLPNSRLALLQAAASNYWIKLKTLLFHLSPTPSIDFRVGHDHVEANADGAGQKVKEAIVKTLDKSKVAMEDSARSAAKFAGDAMEKTAEKVKKTLSDTSPQSEAEL